MRYKEALSNASCPNCGGPTALGEMSFDEHHLRVENARLREEVVDSLGTYQLHCAFRGNKVQILKCSLHVSSLFG